ncbi:YjcZ family sporulation protein (plasmid) [Bacillus pacificus]|nr:YjcZ family sporulation protein [Bacillus pacificus]MDQ7236837.1 YjcZ family sporulation protein [Bacillus pacificus]MDQ7242527.1 YjcZ family sporulation protein [Bacillus pacificus]
MGYGDNRGEGCSFAGEFTLLVVLFILLIIIGCSCFC